jgi:hypothetical protein
VVDGKVSVQATAVPLSQLVRLLDNAMGTNSGINSTLLSQSVSVRFDDLPYDAAVRKIFQGVPLDYIVIQDKGVFVTARSGAVANTSAPPGPTTTTAPPPIAPNEIFGGGPAPLPPGAVDPFATTAPNPSTPTPGATPPTPVTPPPGVPAVAPAIPDFNNPLSAPLPSFGAPAGAPPGGAPGGGLGGGTLIPFGQPIQ